MVRQQIMNQCIILMLSFCLLIMAASRFRASVAQLPVAHYLDGIEADYRRAAIEQTKEFININRSIIERHPASDYWRDQSMLWFHLARQQGVINSKSRAAIVEATAATEAALALSPANAYLAYQMAVYSAIQRQRPEEIINWAMLSVMISPYEPGFMLQRLDVCLHYFDAIKPSDYPFVVNQLLELARHSKKDLIKLLRFRRDYTDPIKKLLTDNHARQLNELLLALENV